MPSGSQPRNSSQSPPMYPASAGLSSASSRIRCTFSRVAGSVFSFAMKPRTKASKRARSSCSRSRLTSEIFPSAMSTIFSAALSSSLRSSTWLMTRSIAGVFLRTPPR